MQFKTLLSSLAFAVFFLIGQSLHSQTLIPRFEHLGVNDGLPHSSVYSITQDKKGFMWFGTPDGLCRYDGNALVGFKYNPATADDVVNNFVRGSMLEDKAGNIWYSNESGIYKWDVYKEKILKVRAFSKAEFGNVSFKAVTLDANGSLWLFNVVDGVFEFNIFSGNLKQYPLPKQTDRTNFRLTYTSVDTAGNIWIRIVYKNDPYIIFNKTSHTYSDTLTSDPPHAVFFGKQKDVQAFDDRLVYKEKSSGQTRTIMKEIGDKKISFYSFDAIRDHYGRLWMTARGNGLFYYDEVHDYFQEYHHDNSKIKSLPFDLTTCLYIDRSQNLWIGIDGGGVAKLDLKQPKFNLFPLSEGDYPVLNDYFTKCFYEDEKGRIWFGSQNNGLNILDTVSSILLNYHHEKNNPNSLPGNMVGSIIKDSGGNIWIGSSGGISLFDEKKRYFKTVPLHGLPPLQPAVNLFVYRLTQLSNGDLLAATLLGLVKVIKQQDGSYHGYHFSDDPRLATSATDAAEMPDGTIYVTIPANGLFELKPTGKNYRVSNVFLNGIDLRAVRPDEKNPGWLWVSTGKGIVHFNTVTQKYSLWDEKNGIANSYIYGSIEDADGNLWISTNGGLSFFNTVTGHFDNYTYQDGLQSNEFNTQSFYKSASGVFYFGGIKGFNWFRPGPVSSIYTKPQAAITRIGINELVFQKDSSFSLSNRITVPYDQNEFSFQFAALDYTRPEANKVQYMLQGWDQNWVATFAKSVRYGNLPPGNYTFRVKVSNAAGGWSNEEKVYLLIKAPFWKQTWFRSAVIILLLLTVILVTKRIADLRGKRKLQLLEKQIAVDTERNRISADMHDEIGSGITQIALLSELIQQQEKDVKGIKNDVNIISVTARRLVQTMSEIIWALNPQNETMENLLAYTREQSQQYFEGMNVDFIINFPNQVPDVKLSNAVRRNLFLVTKEALANAMKHSHATSIQLDLSISNDKYCFNVTDNGTGMPAGKLKVGSNGLRNMKKRMNDIGGTIEWINDAKGTRVEYCVMR